MRARGVSEPVAGVVAEASIAVFKIGFNRWVNEINPRNLPGHIRAAEDALKAMATAPTKKRATRRS